MQARDNEAAVDGEAAGERDGVVPGERAGEVAGERDGEVRVERDGVVPGERDGEVAGEHDGEVRVERDGAVVRLTFAREAARNAMTWRMYDQLEAACTAIAADDTVRVVVLRGAGDRAFIAGTDIGQFAGFTTGEDGLDYEARLEAIVGLVEALPQPTIAVVEGYAVGGGMMIASVCDLRICSTSAKFGMPIARTLGNCLSMANAARLARLLGPAHVKALLLRADAIDAATAAVSGLATEVHDPDHLDTRVDELVAQLLEQAPMTMWATKEALRRVTLADLPDGDDIVARAYGSADFREGQAAFVEKRPAVWRGR
jgi:enoyl-CoA hydratase